MNWAKLRQQLRRELREYLADLRHFREALRRSEGWITLALILAVIFVVVVWFITGLGFDRLNSMMGAFGVWRPRMCRPLGDVDALLLVLDALAMAMLAIMAIGEMMRTWDRMRWKLAPNFRAVAIPAFLMLLSGAAGIAYMRVIC